MTCWKIFMRPSKRGSLDGSIGILQVMAQGPRLNACFYHFLFDATNVAMNAFQSVWFDHSTSKRSSIFVLSYVWSYQYQFLVSFPHPLTMITLKVPNTSVNGKNSVKHVDRYYGQQRTYFATIMVATDYYGVYAATHGITNFMNIPRP